MIIKKLIGRIANLLGFEILRIKSKIDENKINPKRSSLRGILKHSKKMGFYPRTIIDIGVYEGTPELYDTFMNIKYILIDPLEENVIHMERICKSLKNAEYLLVAATKNEGELTINVHADLAGSSLYKETDGNVVDGFERKIQGITLDKICFEKNTRGPYIIKIDTQGSELDVLSGANNVLKETEMIIMEVSLFEFMINGPQLYDVVVFMKKIGFVVYDIFDGLYRPIDGALAQVDIVFVKEKGFFRKTHRFATDIQRKKIKEGSLNAKNRK